MTGAALVNASCEDRPPTLAPATVVAAARGWIGTPYRHQASLRGVGADCLGVIRGVWRELLGPEPEPLPPYARSWAEDGDAELMLDAARRWLVPAPDGAMEAGDVLLFRVARGGRVKHAGIATGPAAMVHAYDGHAVAETAIPEAWLRRLAARFRFPAAQ
ncbi:hypothetical protein GCM10008179_15500 [Hansschlegelia plantiphila]|uniref:NlpC/P60 domain-containing protein n=1 Tax=Hansschlegelia plantiphila TaxID=374655 RepID=A0A9W6J058_9HYPH|nr:hypothetical protein GCM10008179_15500 [Hansschlegelia plantiphila]